MKEEKLPVKQNLFPHLSLVSEIFIEVYFKQIDNEWRTLAGNEKNHSLLQTTGIQY